MPSPQVSSDAEVAQATEVLDAVELHGRGLLNARAGEIEAALGYLAAAAAAERELSDLQRVTLLSTTLECRLARGEIAEAQWFQLDALPAPIGELSVRTLGLLS